MSQYFTNQATIFSANNQNIIYLIADSKHTMRHRLIKQVFINLLNNAHDAIQENGDIYIRTQLFENDRIKISVIDTGHGILKNNLSKIFEPFYSTKGPDKGTGLGLSISYGIIKSHGGDIRVDSEPGKGATFTITLPLQGGEDARQNDSVG